MWFIGQANQLTIKLEGFEQLWALKRRLQIPHYAIMDIDYVAQQPAMQDFKGYMRFPAGTAVPWHFLAGSYQRRGGREFWYIRMRQPGLLTITLKPDVLNYDKIRVTCSPQDAQNVVDWWRARK